MDDELIGSIYAAAAGDGDWLDALGGGARQLNASAAFLFDTRAAATNGGLAVPWGIAEEVTHRFLGEVAAVDVWFHELLRRHSAMTTGICWSTDDLLPERELKRTRFYADYLRPCDLGRNVGAIVAHDSDDPYGPTPLCFYRPIKSEPFSVDDREKARLLSKHFAQAVAIRTRLFAVDENLGGAALERIPTAVIGLSSDRRILLTNPAADAVLRNARPAPVVHGKLRAQETPETVRLERCLHACARYRFDAEMRLTIRLCAPVGSGLVMHLAPAPARSRRYGLAAVGILVRESEAPASLADAMRALYGLTPAESALVDALAQGKSLEDVSSERAVGLATVKTQLSSIFAKTNTRRQSDLMRLAFSLR